MNKLNYSRRYIIAVAVVIALIIINQGVIQYWLGQKKYDAQIINISGKQRMLSQKVLALFYEDNIASSNETNQKLLSTFNEWSDVHFDLLNGDDIKGINRVSERIIVQLEPITKNITYVKKYIVSDEVISREELRLLSLNQNDFLVKMDNIVTDLEEEANMKLTKIVTVEVILALITLLVVFIEIFYIFRPINNQLVLQNNKLKTTNQVLEEYAYIAAHDLRSPIQNMLNFLGLLKRKTFDKFDDNEKEYFGIVEDNAARMSATTEDLLAYSVSNKINKEKVETAFIFEDLLEDLQDKIKKSEATVTIGKLPETISADEDLFRLLMQNLVSNAIKFVPKDRKPIVEVSCSSNPKSHIFKVSDNGIGIEKEYLEKVFKIFQRLNNKETYKGTGIGLAICKRIIEGHEGGIWCESEQGKGSVFFVELPILKMQVGI